MQRSSAFQSIATEKNNFVLFLEDKTFWLWQIVVEIVRFWMIQWSPKVLYSKWSNHFIVIKDMQMLIEHVHENETNRPSTRDRFIYWGIKDLFLSLINLTNRKLYLAMMIYKTIQWFDRWKWSSANSYWKYQSNDDDGNQKDDEYRDDHCELVMFII